MAENNSPDLCIPEESIRTMFDMGKDYLKAVEKEAKLGAKRGVDVGDILDQIKKLRSKIRSTERSLKI